MIRISYTYTCDVCGGEIRPSVIYEHRPQHLVPQPAEVANFDSYALCEHCSDWLTDALERRKCATPST